MYIYTWNHLTLLTYETELFEIELFDRLTLCKQKLCTYVKLNCLKFSETIQLCAKK